MSQTDWLKTCLKVHSHLRFIKRELFAKQECIPVGCVPSAAVTVSRGGVSTLGRVSAPGVGEVYSRGETTPSSGGVSAWGVSALEGVWYPSMH